MESTDMSRRAFVGASAAVAAAATLAHGAARADEGAVAPAEESREPDEVIACDVVVVGAGNSGLSCTLEAAALGLDVVLLEKEGFLGGTLMGTEGIFGLSSGLQVEAGLEMPEKWQIVRKELEYTNYRTDPLLWDDVIDASGADIDWLTEKGVAFQAVDNYLDQSDYDTFHWWEGENGGGAAAVLGEEAQRVATVMTSTPAVGLVVREGRVQGVWAQSYEGVLYRIDAPAVVLAAGGMANDLSLLGEKTGIDLSDSASLFPIHCVGDALSMAVSAGAQETSVSMMNVFGVRGYAPTDPIAVAGTLQPTSLIVNQNGERFMAEDLYVRQFFALVTNSWNAQDKVWCIFDKAQADAWEKQGCICGVAAVKAGDRLEGLAAQLDEAVAGGTAEVYGAETIEELAEAIGVDGAALADTLARYNGLCEAGHDSDMGKDPGYLEALEGPFYAVNPVYSVFATMGGILIDRSTHVLGTDGSPIPGLFSTGSASCGLYKETYCYQVSGGMNAYCCYTGRTAARTIAAER